MLDRADHTRFDWNAVRARAAPEYARRPQVLWVACLAAVIAIALFQIYDVVRRHDIVIETAERDFTSLVRVLGEQTARAVQAVDVVVRGTAADPGILALPAGRQALQQRLHDRIVAISQISDLIVADASGVVIASAERGHRRATSIADQPFFGQPRGDALFVSNVFRDTATGDWTVALCRVIPGHDGPAGLVVAYLDLSYFQRFYSAVDMGVGRALQLVQRNGTLLAAYPTGSTSVGSAFANPVYADLLAGPENETRIRHGTLDGEDRIFAEQAVTGLPFAVIASADKAEVLAAWHVSATHSAARTTLLCASVLLLMGLALRQLRRRERAEAILRVQSAHLDELFESAPEGIVMLDLQGRVTRVNREFVRMFGFGSAQAVGRSLAELIIPESLREEALRWSNVVAEGARVSRETQCLHRDGYTLPVSMLSAPIVTAGEPIAAYAIYRDLTELKQAEAERSRLETRLRQGEKLEAIGTMAGGIAHDFNNILAAMLGYLEMALAAPPESAVIRRHVASVLKATQRARALVDQILSYSRTTQGKPDTLNLQACVDETLDLVRAALPEGIELKSAASEAITVIADSTHIHQIVMNLCTNAIHAMSAGGVLTVSVEGVDCAHDQRVSHGELHQGRYVRLRVEDTGCGMEPQTIARIFEPFFTTKPSGSGTGLGLALVHGMISELGGAIDVTSAPDQGSCFDIYIPRSDAPVAVTVEQARTWTRGSGERVLIVEDERFLMLLSEEMLAALCYEPAGFGRADEALLEFEADPQRFDVAVLDQVMPGMSGVELARRMRELRPQLPVILVSGYVGPLLEQEAAAAGIECILTKPLDLRSLSQAMARVLQIPA